MPKQPAVIGALWADRLSKITCTSSPSGTLRFTLFKNATKSALVWVERMSVIAVPVAMFKAAKRSQVLAGTRPGGLPTPPRGTSNRMPLNPGPAASKRMWASRERRSGLAPRAVCHTPGD